MKLINKKTLLIVGVVILALLLAVPVYFLANSRKEVQILSFNKNGISFNYPSNLIINEQVISEAHINLILTKKGDNSTITIEAIKMPNSYKKFTLEEMSESALATLKDKNKGWESKYSENVTIGLNYDAYSYLLEDSDNNLNAALYIGANDIWLFNILLEGKREKFDILQIEADGINNSIKAI